MIYNSFSCIGIIKTMHYGLEPLYSLPTGNSETSNNVFKDVFNNFIELFKSDVIQIEAKYLEYKAIL